MTHETSLVWRMAAAIVLAAACAAQGGCGLNLISTDREIRLGEEAAPQFLSQGGGEIPDGAVLSYVNDLGHRLVATVEDPRRDELPWEFHVLNSRVLNAFALPGGKVFISRGLMESLQNEAELAAVLGHEIGHVIKEHIGKQMTQAAGQNIAIQIGVAAGQAASDSDYIGVLGGVAQAGGQLYLLSFGRGQESEADREGLRYMIRLHYDPQGLVGVLEVLRAASGSSRTVEFFSTHPHPETRLAQARDLIATRYRRTQNNPEYVLNAEDYRRRALEPLSRLAPPPDAERAQ